MLYDVDYNWIVAIGILIGFSLVLTYLSEEEMNIYVILIYMTIIDGFIVSTGILPLWTVVMFLLIILAVGVMEMKKSKSGVG